MKENRFEKIARHTGQPPEQAQLKTYLRKLNKKKLKLFFGIIVHYWAKYKYFISNQSFLNLWCEFNSLCHELDEGFPDQYDDHKAVTSFCKAHPYYFIDILTPKMVATLFCQHFDDRLDILANIVKKLHTEDLSAAYAYANEALGLNENIDELVGQNEEHVKAFS